MVGMSPPSQSRKCCLLYTSEQGVHVVLRRAAIAAVQQEIRLLSQYHFVEYRKIIGGGRETLATRTRGLTKGRNGSSTTNDQQTGRDLMTIDEVRKLDTHKAILFIRGEDPVIDRKYNLNRHPNICLLYTSRCV